MASLQVALDVLAAVASEGGGGEPSPNPQGRGRKRRNRAREAGQPGGGEGPNFGRRPGQRGGNGRGVGGARAKGKAQGKGGRGVRRGKGEGDGKGKGKGGRGKGGRNSGRRPGGQTLSDRRFNLHSRALNHSGRARTADHLITAPGEKRSRVAGRGRWKVWTADAVARAGFGAEVSAQRDIAKQIDGAGQNNSTESRYVVSGCILEKQQAGLQEIRDLSEKEPLSFFVKSIMWDETTFDLRWSRGGSAVTHSILCSHAQVAYRVNDQAGDVPEPHGPGAQEQHVFRVPQVLPKYNCETLWNALSRLSGGLQESCQAELKATLASCDAHRANLKLLRKMHARLPPGHLLLISLCTQHRAANAIEALTKAVGNLTGVFCLSKVFNYQNVLCHLQKHVSKRMDQVADRVPERPLGNLRQWQDAQACAKELVDLCKACMDPTESQMKDMDDLVEFFAGPWTGPRAQGWAPDFR